MNDLTLLSHQLSQQLLAKDWKLCTAESCTGGLIAASLAVWVCGA